MQIHTIGTRNTQSSKRIGRGGKRGTTSGRGSKGQKARSGGNVDPLFEGGRSSLVERLKKARGFKAVAPKKNTIKLNAIEEAFRDGEELSPKTLVRKGLVDKVLVKNGVKVVGDSRFTKKLTVRYNVCLSESVHQKMVKAGCTIEDSKPKKMKEIKKEETSKPKK